MELADIHGTLPELGYRDLLSNGQVVHLGENRGTASIDARLRRLLLSTVDYRRDRLGDVEVDVQRIRINRGFRPLRLLRDGLKTVIPFRISGQAEVEYARLRWPDEAEPDIRFTLMDLPFDVESALRLPENTIVTIPVEASLAMDIAGNFLTRTASRSTELLGHLKASAYGYTSAVRGTLLAEGRFKIQIIRGEGDMIRLR